MPLPTQISAMSELNQGITNDKSLATKSRFDFPEQLNRINGGLFITSESSRGFYAIY